MNKQFYFERNLLALDRKDDDICERLSAAVTTKSRYRIIEARDGSLIPSIVDSSGKAHPLHSLIDPKKEAKRMISAAGDAGFFIFLGLGGGYHIEEALTSEKTERILIIDFGEDGIAEILSTKDFVNIFNDRRVTFLLDPTPQKIENLITEKYIPVLHGNLRSIPLRGRCDAEKEKFLAAAGAINLSLERISMDYSVQVQFGKKWFSNIIHNLKMSQNQNKPITPVKNAAICAAGPSLDKQIPLIKNKRGDLFIIATDTSLGTLLNNDLIPDAVISIDCQHITYYHFIGVKKLQAILFLDIASPPLLSRFSQHPYFFLDSHPLSSFISKHCKTLPFVDTKGGNVTFAALSLAAALSAKNIEVYGADFSYPFGKSYTSGAYIYKYYDYRQNKFNGMETLFSSFLFRSNTLIKKQTASSWFYQTPSLLMYKNSFVELSSSINSSVVHINGGGDEIKLTNKKIMPQNQFKLFTTGKEKMGASVFLDFYYNCIAGLPLPQKTKSVHDYISNLNSKDLEVFFTLLPLLASIKSGANSSELKAILEETKAYCLNIIKYQVRSL